MILVSAWQYYHQHLQDNVNASIVVGAAAYFVVLKKLLVCQENWCFRIGHHKVEGTHYKTCPKHTNSKVHNRLKKYHLDKYPESHKFLKGKNQ